MESLRSTEGYRKRAAELRAQAATATNPQSKKMLMDVAASYVQLADSIEAMAHDNGDPKSD